MQVLPFRLGTNESHSFRMCQQVNSKLLLALMGARGCAALLICQMTELGSLLVYRASFFKNTSLFETCQMMLNFEVHIEK